MTFYVIAFFEFSPVLSSIPDYLLPLFWSVEKYKCVERKKEGRVVE